MTTPPVRQQSCRSALVAFLLANLFVLFGGLMFAPPASSLDSKPTATGTSEELTLTKAAVLGIVEGVTEYLPVSSTGHLEMTNRLLGVGQSEQTRDAASSYTIAIQAGAIVAVLYLYFGRLRRVALGAIGKDAEGRRLLIALVVSFLPAAAIGLATEPLIKRYLFGPVPIIAAWIVGGAFILWWVRSRHAKPTGFSLEELTPRLALLIGLAQCVAMWPGTSRSLVTIIAAVWLGASLKSAVEYSFLLGLITLGAATSYEAIARGNLMIDTFGWMPIALGFVTAFIAAVISVKWMVSFLERRSFSVFGWYRIGVGLLAIALVVAGVIPTATPR